MSQQEYGGLLEVEAEIEKVYQDKAYANMPLSIKKSRLSSAFSSLRREGFIARQNFWCCSSCACADLPTASETKKPYYVFYHRQDTEGFLRNGELYLAYGIINDEGKSDEQITKESIGAGHLICNALENAGLRYEWNRESGTRIRVI